MADFKRKDAQKLAHRVVEMIEALRTEMAGQDATIARQAAEIERLRAAGERLWIHLDAHYGTGSPCPDDIQRVLDAWREARRV